MTHLRNNQKSTLVTSQQVIDSMYSQASPAALVPPRVLSRTTAPGARQREVLNGITIELLGLPHGGARHRGVQHLGYIVELGGRRVLHVGDTEFTEAVFAPFRLDTARIDVALLPSWAVTGQNERRVIERWIRPKQVVAFHVADTDRGQVPAAVHAAIPGAITFTRSLETRRW